MAVQGSTATVVRTKLVPPSQREALIDRPRLISRSMTCLDYRLIVVSGPAGYGKTGLLSQVHHKLAEEGHNTCWLSLEEGDNDFVRFVNHFLAAIQTADTSTGRATSALLSSGFGLPPYVVMATLLNELASIDSDFYLFLDDFHLITDQAVLELVRNILLSPLARMHMLIGARNPNRLPITRLRTMGRVHELNGFDLAFSTQETSEYFARNTSLSAEQIALIHQSTEGWVAALQLVNIAIGDGEDPDDLLRTLSGERRTIGDFLAEEVFRRQPEELRYFLAATSILKRFDVDLCRTVTGRGEAHELLQRIEETNLFVFALDKERRWFRYHHLFAEFLQRRLREEYADGAADLHRRACDALGSGPFVADAIDHAFAASDLSRASRLLETASAQLFARGETATLRRQASRLPVEVVRALPQLQLELAWDEVILWRFPEARALLDNVAAALEMMTDSDAPYARTQVKALRSKWAHRDMMLSVFADEIISAERKACVWLAEHEIDDLFMQASVGTTRILCNNSLGICNLASQTSVDLHDKFLRAGAVYGTVFHDCVAGTSFFGRGDLERAEQLFRQALETATSLHGRSSPLAAMPAMLLAELLYERDALIEVRALLDLYAVRLPELGFVDNMAAQFVTQMRVSFLDDDLSASLDSFEAGLAMAERLGFARLRTVLLAERARQLQLAAVSDLDEQLVHWFGRQLPEAEPFLPQDLHVIMALARGKPGSRDDPVAALLRNVLVRAERRNCARSAAMAATTLAMMAWRRSERDNAFFYLGKALRLSKDWGFVRTILDEGGAMCLLLRDYTSSRDIADARLQAHAITLLRRMGEPTRDICREIASVGLTSREIQILSMGLESRTNCDIGRTLGLTESTVKWYWQRIFRTLNVHRRSDAVRAARQLNLLP